MNTIGSFEMNEETFNKTMKSVQVICGAAPEHALNVILASDKIEFEKKNEIMKWLVVIFNAVHLLEKEQRLAILSDLGKIITGMIIGWTMLLLGVSEMDAFDLFNHKLSEN